MADQVESVVVPKGLVSRAEKQREIMRWILLFLFVGGYAASTAVHLILLFLVGYEEVMLPDSLLIPLGVATVGNLFPGIVYALRFAFGKVDES